MWVAALNERPDIIYTRLLLGRFGQRQWLCHTTAGCLKMVKAAAHSPRQDVYKVSSCTSLTARRVCVRLPRPHPAVLPVATGPLSGAVDCNFKANNCTPKAQLVQPPSRLLFPPMTGPEVPSSSDSSERGDSVHRTHSLICVPYWSYHGERLGPPIPPQRVRKSTRCHNNPPTITSLLDPGSP